MRSPRFARLAGLTIAFAAMIAQRGCELYLFQPKKAGNLDCTFCLDCVKACPHDNVALLPTLSRQVRLISDPYRSSLRKVVEANRFGCVGIADCIWCVCECSRHGEPGNDVGARLARAARSEYDAADRRSVHGCGRAGAAARGRRYLWSFEPAPATTRRAISDVSGDLYLHLCP